MADPAGLGDAEVVEASAETEPEGALSVEDDQPEVAMEESAVVVSTAEMTAEEPEGDADVGDGIDSADSEEQEDEAGG